MQHLFTAVAVRAVLLVANFATVAAQPDSTLAGTAPLGESGDRSGEMVAGIGRWLEKESHTAAAERARVWQEADRGDSWDAFADARRQQLREIIGAIDPRTAGFIEQVTIAGAEEHGVAGVYTAHNVRWPVFEGVHGEGILFRPVAGPRAVVIAVPDADELPENSIIARQLAAQGCLVLSLVLVDRSDRWSGNEMAGRWTNQPHREWIYRQAFPLGRTVIGYEVQKILAGLEALSSAQSQLGVEKLPVGIAGTGEGGLLALHSAALDPRFRAAVVSGYFAPRERLHEEPIYRNLFGYLRAFGDAELGALLAPRALIVEDAPPPVVTGPPRAREGRTGAAPGAIAPIGLNSLEEVRWSNQIMEWRKGHVRNAAADREADRIPGSEDAVTLLLHELGLLPLPLPGVSSRRPFLSPDGEAVAQRQHRTVRELERFTQGLVREAERKRHSDVWTRLKPGAEWERTKADMRRRLHEDVIGKLPPASLPPNARTRLVRETPQWLAYEVVLDVHPDVFAWGSLLVPRDLGPGERRPAIVCQHGLEGVPEDVINDDPKSTAFGYYKAFAARLAERGFIVFAPHNPYRGGDAFRVLQRRANPLGLSLFSFIIAQHEVATEWLAALPFIDAKRIGFYGLSYGGKTAMRVPGLIDRYCLSICSGDFNEWIRKNVSVTDSLSYMFTGEYEMPEWNLANVANYAEMAMLIAPRPFMVERGHEDGVGLDEWVGYEYAKVLRGYTKLGIPKRTEIEWFDGPHTINGAGTFRFLHEHLGWAVP